MFGVCMVHYDISLSPFCSSLLLRLAVRIVEEMENPEGNGGTGDEREQRDIPLHTCFPGFSH